MLGEGATGAEAVDLGPRVPVRRRRRRRCSPRPTALARKLAAGPTRSLGLSKRLLNASVRDRPRALARARRPLPGARDHVARSRRRHGGVPREARHQVHRHLTLTRGLSARPTRGLHPTPSRPDRRSLRDAHVTVARRSGDAVGLFDGQGSRSSTGVPGRGDRCAATDTSLRSSRPRARPSSSTTSAATSARDDGRRRRRPRKQVRRRDHGAGGGHGRVRQRRERLVVERRRADDPAGGRRVRSARRARQQRGHPARQDELQHGRGRVGRRHRRPPQGPLRAVAVRGELLAGAEQGDRRAGQRARS